MGPPDRGEVVHITRGLKTAMQPDDGLSPLQAKVLTAITASSNRDVSRLAALVGSANELHSLCSVEINAGRLRRGIERTATRPAAASSGECAWTMCQSPWATRPRSRLGQPGSPEREERQWQRTPACSSRARVMGFFDI